jgi:hypothetical protein
MCFYLRASIGGGLTDCYRAITHGIERHLTVERLNGAKSRPSQADVAVPDLNVEHERAGDAR